MSLDEPDGPPRKDRARGCALAFGGLMVVALVGAAVAEWRIARDRPSALPRDGLLFTATDGGNYVASFEDVDLGRVRGGEVPARLSRFHVDATAGNAPGGWPLDQSLIGARLDPEGLRILALRSGADSPDLVVLDPCGGLRTRTEAAGHLDSVVAHSDASGRMLALWRRPRAEDPEEWVWVVVELAADGSIERELAMDPVLRRGGLALSSSGTHIAVSTEGWELEIRDLRSGAVRRVGRGWGAAWSPDGSELAYLAEPELRLFDVTTGEARTLFRLPAGYKRFFWSDAAFSSDGRFVAYSQGRPEGEHRCEIVELATGRRFRPTRRTGTCGPFLPPEWMAERERRCDEPVARLE